MLTIEIFVIALGLAMDAFAVAICKGLSLYKAQPNHSVITGIYFGSFQALMPIIGYIAGKYFENMIVSIDHWIAFFLLSVIGVNMIREAKSNPDKLNNSLNFKEMLPLAVATSIDALAVGITFAFLRVNIFYCVGFIGIITFILSCIGVKIGNLFGSKFKNIAEIFGGIILIIMGIKILIGHLA